MNYGLDFRSGSTEGWCSRLSLLLPKIGGWQETRGALPAHSIQWTFAERDLCWQKQNKDSCYPSPGRAEDRLNSSRCSSCQSAALSNPVPLIVRSEVMTAWPSGPWPWLSYFTPHRTAVTFSTKWGRLSRVFPASARAYTLVGELLWRPGWKDATWSKLYGGVIRNRVFSEGRRD